MMTFHTTKTIRIIPGLLLLVAPLSAMQVDPPAPRSPEQQAEQNRTPEAAREDKQDTGSSKPRVPSLADARDLLMRGEYAQAIAAYEALAAETKHAVEAGLGLARCRLATGQYEEALSGLIALHAEVSAEWHFIKAQAHLVLGQYDDALTHIGQAIERDPRHADARRLQASTFEWLGRRDEAVEAYRWFERQMVERPELPRDAAWLTEAAQGFLRYSVLTGSNVPERTQHVLSKMLQPAYERLDRTWWPARIAAADLLRARYNNDEHDGSISDYLAALRINPNLPEAFVGLGEIALDRWAFEQVEAQAEKALAVNPRFAPAIHLLARKLIVERRYQEAAEQAAKALEINPRDLTALSIAAAAAACRYDQAEVDAMTKAVAEINPRSALFHRTVGDALGGIRQYEASERAYLKAIELEPTDANARTELGMMYMQWGLEDKARDALDAAWLLDPFNERTKFTLELLDRLKHFAHHETEHFSIRYDEERDPGLGEYITDYLEDLYHEVIGDYQTTLEHKTIIEIFPTHRAFGVRITGRPWIHTIGACTGRVIALASPRSSPELMGPYNLASVLKHEFVHTVTLAMTENRIPHWFTEGLAVYQEDSPRSFRWQELLVEAIRRDRLFTLQSIDWGFMRPKLPTDRTMAYAQSEWMCEYIIERFGYDMIQEMIRRFRDAQKQPQVFREALGIEPEAFDRDFHAWARKEAERWGFDLSPPDDADELIAGLESDPDNAELLGRLALAAWDVDEPQAALTAAQRALAINENESRALRVLGMVQARFANEERSRTARTAYENEAIEALKKFEAVEPDNWTAPRLLGEIYLRRKELAEAETWLTRLQQRCPMDLTSWRGLTGIYLERGDDSLAMPQLAELVRLDENDPETAGALARLYKRRGQLHDAIYWYRQSLAIDPFHVKHHQALAETCLKVDDARCALREYRMLTALEPREVKHYEAAALAAQKLGDADQVREWAKKAVAIDPQTSARTLLD